MTATSIFAWRRRRACTSGETTATARLSMRRRTSASPTRGRATDFAAADLDGINLGVDLAWPGPKSSTLQRNQYGGQFRRGQDVGRIVARGQAGPGRRLQQRRLPDFVFVRRKM